MTHHLRLREGPFDLIAKGLKTIELRLFDEKRKLISVGDTLVFTHINDENAKITCIVKSLHIFSSFDELYRALPLDKCGYLPEEIESASAKDMDDYYPREKQMKYGVVGIELELVSNSR